jgi:hypothetical protein
MGAVAFSHLTGASSMRQAKEISEYKICSVGGNGILLLESESDGGFMKGTVIYVEG